MLEAVGVRCTPLSHASRADLASAEEAKADETLRVEAESAAEKQTNDGEERSSRQRQSCQNPPAIANQRELDECSMVVERVDGLRIGVGDGCGGGEAVEEEESGGGREVEEEDVEEGGGVDVGVEVNEVRKENQFLVFIFSSQNTYMYH